MFLDTRHFIALICTAVVCLLILVMATLDNVTWWSASFPDEAMSRAVSRQLLQRFRSLEPGLKVSVQHDDLGSPNLLTAHKVCYLSLTSQCGLFLGLLSSLFSIFKISIIS